ncbi:hypothetical protein SMQE13_30260 [Serratia marcescens]|nr:hypothetical protein SMQE13_30260 [Serratia marcescens]
MVELHQGVLSERQIFAFPLLLINSQRIRTNVCQRSESVVFGDTQILRINRRCL